MSAPGSNPFPFPYMPPGPPNMDPNVAAALYHQQAHQQAGLPGPQTMFPPPPPSQPTPLSDTSLDSPDPSRGGSVNHASAKRPARDSDAARKKTKLDTDGDYDDGETDSAAPGNSSQKVKQTRGSRACTVCRRLKMKCVGAENGPPCKRCEAGGHECVFEESNRGKRSTKKSEALQRSLNKMEKTLDIPHCTMLDPNWHTPSLVCSRSPFLLTAICAVSSKFYAARPDLHQKLNKIAKKLAFSVPEQGYKSVEIVQAYLILFLWGIGPVERFEQERTWTILGLAIRVATDINLHRKIPYAEGDSPDARATNLEIRNRERAWLLCYVLDRSFSTQMGKPHSVKEDFIIRTANKWWQHPHALPLDVGLAAYVDYQRTLSRALDFLYSGTSTPSGLQIDCDYLMVIKTFETQLSGWGEEWSFHNREAMSHGVLDRIVEYRGLIAQFYYHYANVVINSFGLQNALERSPTDIAHFFGRCHSAAMSCARIVKEELAPKGYMRYSPDSHFVLFSYALLTLLKLIRTEFRAFIQNEDSILSLVGEVADLFDEMAVNQYHTPALYSSFLRALVSSKAGQTRDGTPAPGSENNVPTTNGDGDASMQEPPSSNGAHAPTGGAPPSHPQPGAQPDHSSAMNSWNGFNAFNNYSGEIGPTQVQDLSTFPPTFASPTDANDYPLFSMDNILGDGFWDSVLMPGYNNSFEGLSGGFVYGAGGSGFITPKRNSPVPSGANSPLRGLSHQFTPNQFNTAFKSGSS
ncbi:hypothetical protein FRB90_004396 [Tulasnella sp. 427]|nr:hypothetical protein FRB90_004396 [Tulasnella sp. 427]